ncbi:hypothetical protein B0H11DRAFT_1955653 [Mycena galericulata]|nr:hypothetical protein B0H11DRAFT_1955653 [Mycena galericulata]
MKSVSFLASFPQELVDLVIDEAADSSATLRSCALVCKAFLPSSQAHIFSQIELILTAGSTPSQRFERLYEVLCQSPHFIRYIKNLQIICYLQDDTERDTVLESLDTSLFLVLSLLPSLRSFSMTDLSSTVWRQFPARSKAAMCDLCRRSDLSRLVLNNVKQLTISEFSWLVSSPSLTDLTLGTTTILPGDGEAITGGDSQLTSVGFHESKYGKTETIISWLLRGNRLSKVTRLWGTWKAGNTAHLQELIDACNRTLRDLYLMSFFDLYQPSPTFQNPSLASTPSLRVVAIEFSVYLTRDAGHLIPRLTNLLESHGSPSTLTTISLRFKIFPVETSSTSSGPQNWEILARLLTEDRFPALETFIILLHGKDAIRLPELPQRILDTIKRAFPELEARGILKFRASDRIPANFF